MRTCGRRVCVCCLRYNWKCNSYDSLTQLHSRSQLVSYATPVYTLSWGPDSDSLLIASSNKLLDIIKTQSRGKSIQWDGLPKEKGVVTALDWNHVNNLIVSGGEDCCYRIFDR